MVLQLAKKHWITGICAVILFVFFLSACTINFSGNPGFYSTDMYTDMVYAQEVWEHKSIFPQGWVFGNQLYAVATPVLAALFYGICGDQVIAMALATTVMGVLVLVSFVWMIKAVFPGIRPGLLGAAMFAALPLSYGGAVHEVAGWQLFFTMCSFYACYAVAACLAFGCYIRSTIKSPKKMMIPLVLAGIMAVGTGVQSLRQTLIMTCPLVAVEGLWVIWRLLKKRPVFTNTTVTCLLIAVCNLAGVLFAKIAEIPQVEIFGKITWLPWADGLKNIQGSTANALSLLGLQDKQTAVLAMVAGGGFLLYLAERMRKKGNKAGLLCLLLLLVSVLGVWVLDSFTTMYIRSIYYFLLYPLVAVAGVAVFFLGKGHAKAVVTVLLVLIFANGVQNKLPNVLEQARQPKSYQQTVDFLEENGVTTLFTGWNRGDRIAIASHGKIKAAFWDSYKTPFVAVEYLCDPAGFGVSPEQCAYAFLYASEAEVAISKARERGVELTLLTHIAAEGVYLYTADVNLMTGK